MDVNEVIEKYITDDVLVPYEALEGYLLQSDNNGTYIEVTDKECIKKAYLNKYEDFIFNKFKTNGLSKNIELTELTNDEREILKFLLYDYILIDREETQKINEYKEKYGEYCLNTNKIEC